MTQQVVVITGASSGIGRAIALQLAARGDRLALAARGGDALEETARECCARGANALPVQTNVASQSECAALIEQTLSTFGQIDTLINNAGITMRARFDEITDLSLFEQIMRINLLGSVWCTSYALPHLKRSRGRIVAVSSLTGKFGTPMRTAYAASKHAMAGFFDSLRIELAESGVSVTTVYPGFVASEIRSRALGADGKPLRGNAQNEADDMTAEECARIIIAASDARKREVIMTAKGKAGVWLKLMAPRLVDHLARRTMERRQR